MKYPHIVEVQQRFDVVVIGFVDGVWLGQKPDLETGLTGFTMTPTFKSLVDLESFCKRNIERFRAIPEGEPAPDATDWE
jgi:hypothetical protein